MESGPSSVANSLELKYNAQNLMNDLLELRGEFPILEKSTYMISNSLGAMPRAVYDRMRAYADSWGNRGIRAWEEGWWEMAVSVGDKIAPLIGAGAGELSLHQNVTITQAIISSCFDFRGARNKIVMVEQEFPSVQYFHFRAFTVANPPNPPPTITILCITPSFRCPSDGHLISSCAWM